MRPTWKQKRLCKNLLIELGYTPEDAQREVNKLKTFRQADQFIKVCLPELRVKKLKMEDRKEILETIVLKLNEIMEM